MTDWPRLDKIERIPLRDAWNNKESEFVLWLAQPDNFEGLANALGIDRPGNISSNQWVDGRKLDILCVSQSEVILVATQLAETDEQHLGAIISRASIVGADAVVWIADSFDVANRRAMMWLNSVTTPDAPWFFGVTIDFYRVGESLPAPLFQVVVAPDEWINTTAKLRPSSAWGFEARKMRLEFWTALLHRLSEICSTIECTRPGVGESMNFTLGQRDSRLHCLASTSNSRLRVLTVIRPRCSGEIAAMVAKRKSIESLLPFPIEWEESTEPATIRVSASYHDAHIEDRRRWNEYLGWFEERVVALDRVISPIAEEFR